MNNTVIPLPGAAPWRVSFEEMGGYDCMNDED